jgi:hypothetical protein
MPLKHTSGPWLREGRTVYTLSDRGVNHFYVRVEADPRTCSAEEAEANAAVMAAAPDLVKALEELCIALESVTAGDLVTANARAALRKARVQS